MTTKVTPLATPRKDAILRIMEQMTQTEGKSYSAYTIAQKLRCESGKWVMESKSHRYEVNAETEDATANVK